jgi:hypothetical protein
MIKDRFKNIFKSNKLKRRSLEPSFYSTNSKRLDNIKKLDELYSSEFYSSIYDDTEIKQRQPLNVTETENVSEMENESTEDTEDTEDTETQTEIKQTQSEINIDPNNYKVRSKQLFICNCTNGILLKDYYEDLNCDKCGEEFNTGQKLLIVTENIDLLNNLNKNNDIKIEELNDTVYKLNKHIVEMRNKMCDINKKKSFSKNVLNLIINTYCV